ncbi:PTS lactose/cellobiose transporter subunit IIA [Mycoplasmopsis lipofaciens]|uniref:PTS lactose/cellobiose transporter subunit IIA n=1 Tax=Mycoplasmopsis lipofaciens TaxID=114884 RepID=UPI000480B23F|nr:PTS lactose/cellobiose transporter subunit IIA [Mycoplasmopsis lipofaciens]
MDETKLEQACFEIISYSGEAKSLFLSAIDFAMDFDFETAKNKIKEGKSFLQKTHKAHADMLTADINGELKKMPLILVHAEDQFMGCEQSLVLAEKIIKMMQKFETQFKK